MPWTALRPSSRATQLRRVAAGLAIGSCAALAVAAFASDPFDPVAALLAVAGGLGVWTALKRSNSRQFDVGVSSAGRIELREHNALGSSTPETIRTVFASPWLISLRSGTMLIPIWPDSLPQSTYRQLWVHLRWGRAMPSGDREAVPINRANSLDQ